MSCKILQGKYAERLEKENKELKAEIQEANDSITWWANRFKAVERDNRELHERIDKAIEYIKECQEVWHKRGEYWENELVDGTKLLEILGADEND